MEPRVLGHFDPAMVPPPDLDSIAVLVETNGRVLEFGTSLDPAGALDACRLRVLSADRLERVDIFGGDRHRVVWIGASFVVPFQVVRRGDLLIDGRVCS